MGNFQGTYKRPGNQWDLKNYRQKTGETLRGYIRRFSRQCNELPNIADADVIGAFLSGTTCESLVHKLGRRGPRTTKELLDIATSHASGEEADGAIFDRTDGKARRDEATDEGTSDRPAKRKKQEATTRQPAHVRSRPQRWPEARGGHSEPLRENARGAMPKPRLPGQASIQGVRPHAQIPGQGT